MKEVKFHTTYDNLPRRLEYRIENTTIKHVKRILKGLSSLYDEFEIQISGNFEWRDSSGFPWNFNVSENIFPIYVKPTDFSKKYISFSNSSGLRPNTNKKKNIPNYLTVVICAKNRSNE